MNRFEKELADSDINRIIRLASRVQKYLGFDGTRELKNGIDSSLNKKLGWGAYTIRECGKELVETLVDSGATPEFQKAYWKSCKCSVESYGTRDDFQFFFPAWWDLAAKGLRVCR